MCGCHLAVDVGREVVRQQVVVAAGGDGLNQGLKEVLPAKGAAAYQAHRVLEAAGPAAECTSAADISRRASRPLNALQSCGHKRSQSAAARHERLFGSLGQRLLAGCTGAVQRPGARSLPEVCAQASTAGPPRACPVQETTWHAVQQVLEPAALSCLLKGCTPASWAAVA